MKPFKVCSCGVMLRSVIWSAEPQVTTLFTLGKAYTGTLILDDGEERPDQEGEMVVPLYPPSETYEELIESDHRDEFDLLKFKVADGKYEGYVGYALIRERVTHGLAR